MVKRGGRLALPGDRANALVLAAKESPSAEPGHSLARHVGVLSRGDQEAAAPPGRLEAHPPRAGGGLVTAPPCSCSRSPRRGRRAPGDHLRSLAAAASARRHQDEDAEISHHKSPGRAPQEQAEIGIPECRSGAGPSSIEPDPPRAGTARRRSCACGGLFPVIASARSTSWPRGQSRKQTMQADEQHVVGLHLERTERSAPYGRLVDRADEIQSAPARGVGAEEQVVVVSQPVSNRSRQRRAVADLLTVYVEPN